MKTGKTKQTQPEPLEQAIEAATRQLIDAGVKESLAIEFSMWQHPDRDEKSGWRKYCKYRVWLSKPKRAFESERLAECVSKAIEFVSPAQGDQELADYVGVPKLMIA